MLAAGASGFIVKGDSQRPRYAEGCGRVAKGVTFDPERGGDGRPSAYSQGTRPRSMKAAITKLRSKTAGRRCTDVESAFPWVQTRAPSHPLALDFVGFRLRTSRGRGRN